jgi:hypothetical protein
MALRLGKPIMTIEERRSTAVHEAGHVIVAWTLGLPVGAMEIGVNGDDTAGNSEIADAGAIHFHG